MNTHILFKGQLNNRDKRNQVSTRARTFKMNHWREELTEIGHWDDDRQLVNTSVRKWLQDEPLCSSQQDPSDGDKNSVVVNDEKLLQQNKPPKVNGYKAMIKRSELTLKETPWEEKEAAWKKKLDDLRKMNDIFSVLKLNQIMMLLTNQEVLYKLVSTTTDQNKRQTLTYMVILNEKFAMGAGHCKKEAMNNAAIEFMKKLDYDSYKYNEDPIPIPKIKSEINYYILLNNLSRILGWAFPEYIFAPKSKRKGYDWYTVKCLLKDFEFMGEGKSHVKAANQAARPIYEQIINNLYQKKPKDSVFQSCSKFFLRQLCLSKNTSLSRLKVTSMGSKDWNEIRLNAIHFLYAIAEEEQLNIKYENKRKPRINTYGFDIVVELTINPFLMFVGTGLTALDAQNGAAFNAVQYIRLKFDGQC